MQWKDLVQNLVIYYLTIRTICYIIIIEVITS